MTKAKIKPGLAALIVVASMFAGWQTLLIVCALLLLFCELDEKVKNIMVSVITFTAGVALFTLAWNLIVDGVGVLTSSLNGVFDVINSYLDAGSKIDISELQRYLLNPITKVVGILDGIVDFLVAFAKFGFILAIIVGKPIKRNFVYDKINGFVNNFINYVTTTDNSNDSNSAA